MDKKRILVTGASGFIGQHCLPRLVALGFEVHAIGRSIRPSIPGIHFHSVDIFDHGALRLKLQEIRATHLLHCAWIATPGVFWKSPENIDWLTATIHLVKQFGEMGGQRALGIGSCAEYDWSGSGMYSENVSALLPGTVYGKCKLAASQAFAALAELFDFSFAWGRLFFPYGVGEPSNKFISAVMRGLIKGEVVACSHGRQVRDFLYIEDVADAIVALLVSEGQGVYNIASGKPTSLREIVNEITFKIGGQELVQFGSLPEQPGEPLTLIGDPTRLFEQVSWRPKIDLSSGIERMLEVLSTT